MEEHKVILGDFSTLAENYAKYRPGYSDFVCEAFLGLLNKDRRSIKGVDVGAGTGIFTRMLAKKGVKINAVEPNKEMRNQGISLNEGLDIQWIEGSAEDTKQESSSLDFVSMASAFHWADFDKAVSEFSRILKPQGLFICLWNPRDLSNNEFLLDIEKKLYELKHDLKRKSSGNSTFCNSLSSRLRNCPFFSDVIYLEGHHVEIQTPERYIGLWESVNDIKAQLGNTNFSIFMDYIKSKVKGISEIRAEYKTRAWIAKKK